MKSRYRSSRRVISWTSCPARACARCVSQVVTVEVNPPTTEPPSAESADMYAISIPLDLRVHKTAVGGAWANLLTEAMLGALTANSRPSAKPGSQGRFLQVAHQVFPVYPLRAHLR